MKSIGLMSGTSMDGIDAALVETDGEGEIKALGNTSLTYSSEFKMLLKSAEFAVRSALGNLIEAQSHYSTYLLQYLQKELKISQPVAIKKIKELSHYLYGVEREIKLSDIILKSTDLHVLATQKLLNQLNCMPQEIEVIGYHGQTLYHQPRRKISIIVGEGQYLANKTGIKVINDFRSQDIAAGGQGAPFAPLYHYALAKRDNKIPVGVINCGGIANVTLIPTEDVMDLVAYDSGPGNGLIDNLIRRVSAGRENMDCDGKYGKQGRINKTILALLHEKAVIAEANNYLALPPPKALDIGDMHLIPELDTLSLADACATLEAFTAQTIVDSLQFYHSYLPSCWILAGGGWKNPVIRQEFDKRLKKKIGKSLTIQTADEVGWNSMALEAQIFAYLAVRSLNKKPLSFPHTTRVSKPMCGGQAYFSQS